MTLVTHSRLPSTGNTKHHIAGFTLLELLIVMFIIGMLSGLTMLTVGFGKPDQSLENETRRLHRLMGLTAQEAILQGREIGIMIERDNYRFLTPGKEEWVAVESSDVLKKRELPEGWHMELIQHEQEDEEETSFFEEGLEELAEIGDLEEDEEKQAIPPPIIFYATGEVTPFQLTLSAQSDSSTYVIKAEANGEIEMSYQGMEQ